MSKKLFLLDAMALIYRAYYALIRNPRITSKGRNTNAQFGFTNTLFDLINKEKPTHLAVCFDTFAPTERHTDFTDYKANRQEAPEDLLASLPDIKRIIKGFNIPCLEVDGYEADDVIGTLAWEAAAAGYEVYMVTPDKDYGQLLTTEGVFIYKPGYQGGDVEILTAQKVCDKWGIERVDQVVDILGLMGDAVDNIPGIAGVGEKTASKLLKEYGTLENVLAHADTIKGSLGEKIRAGRENAIMSKKLATIITNVPVDFHEEDFRLKEWNKEALIEVFTELEFKSLGKRILGDSFNAYNNAPVAVQTDLFGNAVETKGAPVADTKETITEGIVADKNITNTPHDYRLVDTTEAISELISLLLTKEEVSFDTETTGTDPNNVVLVGMSFSFEPGTGYYIPFPKEQDKAQEQIALFRNLFAQENITWVGQNIKYDMIVLQWYGITLKGKLFDTMLAHYLVEPEGRRSMDLLSAQYLGYEPVPIEDLIGKKGKGQGNMQDVELEKIKEYAAEDADITLQLKHRFAPMLIEKKVQEVFDKVENPLVQVLSDMEFEGVRIDTGFLKEYSKALEIDAKKHEENVYEIAGVRFNLSSPRQLGEVLFEKLQRQEKQKPVSTRQAKMCWPSWRTRTR
jgi:DNA polymerase I